MVRAALVSGQCKDTRTPTKQARKQANREKMSARSEEGRGSWSASTYRVPAWVQIFSASAEARGRLEAGSTALRVTYTESSAAAAAAARCVRTVVVVAIARSRMAARCKSLSGCVASSAPNMKASSLPHEIRNRGGFHARRSCWPSEASARARRRSTRGEKHAKSRQEKGKRNERTFSAAVALAFFSYARASVRARVSRHDFKQRNARNRGESFENPLKIAGKGARDRRAHRRGERRARLRARRAQRGKAQRTRGGASEGKGNNVEGRGSLTLSK